MVKLPLERLSDLQLADQNVTFKHLVDGFSTELFESHSYDSHLFLVETITLLEWVFVFSVRSDQILNPTIFYLNKPSCSRDRDRSQKSPLSKVRNKQISKRVTQKNYPLVN